MRRSCVHQSSSIIPFPVRILLQRLIQFRRIAKKIRIFPLLILLGSGVPAWVLTEAIAPQVVQAYTARVDLAIDGLPEENYETILRRAEASARAAAQRSFDQDILITDVSIVVSVQNYGAIAPVLDLRVSRQQWRNRPDPQIWATYFKTARSLLFFGQFGQGLTTAAPSTQAPTPPPQGTTNNTPAASP
jgi:hypothetical protein